MTGIRDATMRDQCIALAGMFQAARLVQQTSRADTRDAAATTASLGSIFNTDPDTAADVYGHPGELRVGLEVLKNQLDNKAGRRDMELTGYVITLMQLERRLNNRPDLMNRITAGIDRLKTQADNVDTEQATLIAGLADIYKETASTLRPRIMVKGDEGVLSHSSSQNMIRALLLAGIRAAVLWSQCGGSRIKLIFRRKALLEYCNRMLREENQSV